MTEENQFIELRRKLQELNRLETQAVISKASGPTAAGRDAVVASLRENISPGVLAHHDRLMARGVQSLAEVKNGVCSGCHMRLPIGTLAEVTRKSMLVRCNHCGCFVFCVEEISIPEPKKLRANRRSIKQ